MNKGVHQREAANCGLPPVSVLVQILTEERAK